MAEHLSLSFCGCYCLHCPGPSCTCTTPPALPLSEVTIYYGIFFIYMYHLSVPQSTSATGLQGQGQFFFCLFLSYFGWSKEHIHHIREKVLILAFRCSCCIKQGKCMTASLIPATLLSSVHLSTKTVWLIGKMCDLSVSRVPSFPIVPLSSQFWHHWKQRVRLLLKMEWFYATY